MREEQRERNALLPFKTDSSMVMNILRKNYFRIPLVNGKSSLGNILKMEK